MIIPQNIKEKILSVSRIEDVIGDFIELKKSGINYRGFSPFSKEKNPSFIVSPIKNIWKDFSSGKGGDVIAFLMESECFTYIESIKYLANKYNIKIDKKFFYKRNNNDYYVNKQLFCIHNYAKHFFSNQLLFNKEGIKYGLNYLKNRGFNIEIIKKFELGYALNSWKNFTNNSLRKGFKISDLINSGLVTSKNYNNFDSFRKRIMFPIHDISGYVVGFGGRSIDKCSLNVVKYINSAESPIFQKSNVLYGFFQSRKNILKENICYLVEGYTDVISLYQSGIKNVVSTSGISITVNQILLIKQLTKNIILFYDGDISGIKASLRIINMFLEQDINLRVLFLSNGEDPDSISRKYSYYDLRTFINNNSYNFISFKQKVYEKYHNNDIVKKSFLIFGILNSISKINNVIQRELYLQEVSRIFNIRYKILIYELKKIYNDDSDKYNIFFFRKKKKEKEQDSILLIEKTLIKIAIKYGEKTIQNNNKNVKISDIILQTFKRWNISFLFKKSIKIFENICLKQINNNMLHCYSVYTTNTLYKKNTVEWDNCKEKKFKLYLQEILLRYKSLYILRLIKNEIYHYNNTNVNNNKKIFIKRIIYLTNLKNKINKKLHRYV
ncbi:DNA primase [Blattabacterium cuenoti]|uniref:DNA primase n=1 Tax=Blattabacterium cuenoti TaxID=1653831 RepID=UPI00163C670E|nr:DNA primase [Blattabacterium cuenoti]